MQTQPRGLIALALLIAFLAFGLYQAFQVTPEAPPTSAVPSPAANISGSQPQANISGTPEASIAADEPERAPNAAAPADEPAPTEGVSSAARTADKSNFDHYMVALSWSPTYCLEEADPNRDRRQCAAKRPYAFILHGLWPQKTRGYPENCSTNTPRVPDAIIDGILDIMPSKGLAGHQWRKHGACTGLDHAGYFSAARKAYRAVTIPPKFQNVTQYQTTSAAAVEAAFMASNPGLTADGIIVTCTRKHLREVRICMTPDYKFRSCGAGGRRDCELATLVMPPAR